MKTAVLLGLLLSGGCVSTERFGTPADPAVLEAAVVEWQNHDLPIRAECQSDIAHLRVTLLDTNTAELNDICPITRVTNGGRALGCTYRSGEWTSIILNTDYPETRDLALQHELRHWLGWCSFDDQDVTHSDMRRWYDYKGHSVTK